MINLEVFGEVGTMREVADLLDEFDGVSRVRVIDAARPGHSVVVAAVRPRVADALLDQLRRQGVPDADITLSRVEVVARASQPGRSHLRLGGRAGDGLAQRSAHRPLPGVHVRCRRDRRYGVIERSEILIVGAMAVSPDLLPITAIGVGLCAPGRGSPAERW